MIILYNEISNDFPYKYWIRNNNCVRIYRILQSKAKNNSEYLKSLGHEVAGEILAPGTLEGGDFIWLNNSQCAVGLGPRTNQEGISQLAEILGKDIELHVVPLPAPSQTVWVGFQPL